MAKSRICIMASGSGSNAMAIYDHFQGHDTIEVAVVLCNRRKAGIFAKCKKHKLECIYIPKNEFQDTDMLLGLMKAYKIDFIALAGFLLLIPPALIKAFPNRMVNIHPSLLPKYGGPGMYGQHVHEAVAEAGEKESGMTVHFVSEEYDKGEIIFQAKTPLLPSDDPKEIAAKVLTLEHCYYPQVIEHTILVLRESV